MKSNVLESCIRNTYTRVHHHHTPAHWQYCLETQRGTNGGGSGSPALAEHRKISSSLVPAVEKLVELLKEDIDSNPHMHGPESQLETESVIWSREDIEGTQQGRTRFYLQVYRDNTRKGWKFYLSPT